MQKTRRKEKKTPKGLPHGPCRRHGNLTSSKENGTVAWECFWKRAKYYKHSGFMTNIPDLLVNIINHFPAAIFEWQCNKMWQNHRKLSNLSFWHLSLPVKFWQTFGISLLHIPSHPQMNTHDCRYWIEISKWILRLLREWQCYKKFD